MPASFYVSKKCGDYMKQYDGKRLKIKCFIVGTRRELYYFTTSRGGDRKRKEHGCYSYDCDMNNVAALIDGNEIYLKRELVFSNVTSFSDYDESEVTFEVDFTIGKSDVKSGKYFCEMKYPRWICKKQYH